MKTHIAILTLIFSWNACSTAGVNEDFELFRNGEKMVWDSTGHEKANGIRMKISYPRTWKAKEGSRPHMVQKFVSDAGRGMDIVTVEIRALPKPFDRELTETEKQELVSRDMAKAYVPDGGQLLFHRVTKIDGETCAMVEFKTVNERVGLKVGLKRLAFIVPRNGVLLIIECTSGGDLSASGFDLINQRYARAKPLFLLISSSCVLTEKWDP